MDIENHKKFTDLLGQWKSCYKFALLSYIGIKTEAGVSLLVGRTIFRIDKPSYKLKARLIDTWHEEIKANINKGRLLEASKDFSFVDLEAIKTYLVMNKLNTENWDLNYALEQFNLDRKIQKKSKKPGFNYGDQIRS